MNLFVLAELELKRERKSYTANDVIDYAIKIRKFMDIHRLTDDKIGQENIKFYHYGNKIKIYEPK